MDTVQRDDERLPRDRQELEDVANYYDTHDTSDEMRGVRSVDPRPMKTTSLRLPSDVIDALKARAHERGVRYTSLLRQILETAATDSGEVSPELAEINARLARIEAAVTRRAS